MALRLAVVVSQAPGLGVRRRPATARRRSRTPQPPPPRRCRGHRTAWSGRRSQEWPHRDLPVADLRRLGGELERHIQIGGLPHPDAGEVFLRLHERPVAELCLLAPVVDDRGRVGVPESARENPVAPAISRSLNALMAGCLSVLPRLLLSSITETRSCI